MSYKPVLQHNNESIDAKYSDKIKKRTGKQKKANIIMFGGDSSSFDGLSVTSSSTRGESGKVVVNHNTSKSSNISLSSENSDSLYEISRPAVHMIAAHNGLNNSEKEEMFKANFSIQSSNCNAVEKILQNSHTTKKEFNRNKENSSDYANKQVDPVKKLPGQLLQHDEVLNLKQQLSEVDLGSQIDNHDLVMDDWSVRSNSVLLRETHSLNELYPVQDNDIYSQSYEDNSDIIGTSPSSSSILLNQKSQYHQGTIPTTSPKLIFDEKELIDTEDLRQALIAVMQRKDEIKQSTISMRILLDAEMEHSAALRLEIEKLQLAIMKQTEETNAVKQQANRENEILRNQLKIYVGAVQNLQKDGDLTQSTALKDNSKTKEYEMDEDAEIYEKKLIEVAEMHGELMEFNERLHKRLQSAIALLHNMKTELVDLRGPMNTDDRIFQIENDNISLPPETLSQALINIWMPSVFQKVKGPESHHVYQVFIRISDEEWNVYRRYSHFYELHNQIRKKYPIIDTYAFPPKKTVGNKGTKFVEHRRKGLQNYLRLLMNSVVQNHEKIVAHPTKHTLVTVLPFFSETMITSEDPSRSKGKFSSIKSHRK